MRTPMMMLVLAMVACRGKVSDTDGDTFDTASSMDSDGDGFTGDVDCNDADPTINPAATEACDGIDQDCDGVADEALASNTFYLDADGDGVGDGSITIQACSAPPGYASVAGDCNDADKSVGSGTELCDGLPNGCANATWDPSMEAGHISFFPSTGAPVDLTPTLTGADFAPGHWTATGDGTIKVCSGTFYGSVSNGGHNLVIDGVDRSVTTLSGGHGDRALLVTGGSVTVEDVTIRDGFTSTSGGNVSCSGGSMILTRVRVTGGLSTAQGGGLYFATCPAVLTDVQVEDNTALQGGGIWFSSNQTWTSVTVDANSANGGGAGAYGTGATLSASGGQIMNNDANNNGDGGGLSLTAVAASLNGTSIRDNNAHRGAGVFLSDSDLTLTSLDFRNNQSDDTGAHVELTVGSTLVATEVTFREGDASQNGNGGTIAVRDASTFTLNGGEIRDNQGDRTGGIWIVTGTANFFNTDFRNNDPDDAYARGNGYDIGTGASGVCSDASGCLY